MQIDVNFYKKQTHGGKKIMIEFFQKCNRQAGGKNKKLVSGEGLLDTKEYVDCL